MLSRNAAAGGRLYLPLGLDPAFKNATRLWSSASIDDHLYVCSTAGQLSIKLSGTVGSNAGQNKGVLGKTPLLTDCINFKFISAVGDLSFVRRAE